MKIIRQTIITTLLCLCVSCGSPAHVSVTTSDGSNIVVDSQAQLGGRTAVVAKAGGATVAVSANYEDSFREGAKTGRFIAGAVVVGNAVNSAADTVNSTVASDNATKVALGTAAQQTKQAKIAADAAAKVIP